MKPIHAIAAFVIGIAIMNLLYTNELLLLIAMGIAVVAVLAIDNWKNTYAFAIAAIVGGSCEALCLFFGVWEYSVANFSITPIWVPLAWGMAVILFDEAFPKTNEMKFKAIAIPMSFFGAVATSIVFSNELFAAVLFALGIGFLFMVRFYDLSDFMPGIMAGFFGAGMEVISVLNGNWHYATSSWVIPLWLPLAWFNALLVMRRIIIK